MKNLRILCLAIMLCSCTLVGVSERNTIYQVSTITALAEGRYDGVVSYSELRRHGDFGIGTFERLDGEMVLDNGVFYRVAADGRVYIAADGMNTPFAVVTFFAPTIRVASKEAARNSSELKAILDRLLSNGSIPYAIRIHGRFEYVRTRSVVLQMRPYPKLSDALKEQKVFERRNIEGTIVGFRIPEYMKGINSVDYHFHFISSDKKFGGHMMDVTFEDATIEAAPVYGLFLRLPVGIDLLRKD